VLTEITRDTADGPLVALARPGRGRPIVVVHGMMADAYGWRDVVERLVPERPALVVNRRGRRPSAPTGGSYSVATEVDDLLGWLAVLDEPVDLVGHSFGGLIAVEAVRRGASARSMVLYEPVARPFGRAAIPGISAAIDRGDLDTAVEMINIDVSGYSPDHVRGLREGPGWAKLRDLAAPLADELSAVDDFAFEPDAYRAIDVPVTVIAGEHSRHRPPYGPGVDLFRHALDQHDVVLLDGHDHLAHITGPGALAAAIESGLVEGSMPSDVLGSS
jgi:pimeloyl-ACP methyl ester carboxylesterase